jgi:hypothetical protein
MTDDTHEYDYLPPESRRLAEQASKLKKNERICSECLRTVTEFDFYYGETVPGYDCIGRIYVCRECLGEEAWASLADVPEIQLPAGTGRFTGRSDRIGMRPAPGEVCFPSITEQDQPIDG